MSFVLNELKMDREIDTTLQYESTWHKLNVVLQTIITKSDPIRDYDLIPAINLLEYQVAVYGIYIYWKICECKVKIDQSEYWCWKAECKVYNEILLQVAWDRCVIKVQQ